jgi:hypothetical protein
MHCSLFKFAAALNSALLFWKLLVYSRCSCSVYQRLSLFNVCSSCENCPSATYASAANAVRKDVDLFVNKIV